MPAEPIVLAAVDDGTPMALFAAASPAPVGDAAEPLPPAKAPPSTLLQYDMRRGLISGRGELAWQLDGRRYELRLEGTVAGLSILRWTSRGVVGPHGLEPERFTEQRLRRAPQAINFDHAAGRITFSGPSIEHPWAPGTQDRLSWMVQVAAIARAKALVAGERLTMRVVGVRGDAESWTFAILGEETVDTGDARVRAWHLLREPRKPYDTRVEAWLDPARGWLPVRARLSNREDGSDALDLLRREP